MNYLIDNNVIIDYYDEIRSKKYPASVETIGKLLKTGNMFISSSSIDNLDFVKRKKLKEIYGFADKNIMKYYMQDILTNFKIAKTPSYMEIDYDDIEDSQIIASAKAIDAKVITRDEDMLKKYPMQTIHPSIFTLPPSSIDFANLKKQHLLYQSEIEEAIDEVLNKTRAIIAVSLYGQPCDIDALEQFKIKHSKLKIIIDGAQSFGSTYKGKTDSNLGDVSTTSFFPAKPLGCYGDGGAVFTNDDELAEKMKSLRLHGQSKRYHHKYIGMGGRLDTIQAAVLNVKLKHYPKDLKLRQEVARKYHDMLNDTQVVPTIMVDATSAWAQYSIRVKNRDEVQARLKEAGIPTAVHYPMPLHLQECFQYLGYKKGDFPISEVVSNEIMSLPMNPYMSNEEIVYIVEDL